MAIRLPCVLFAEHPQPILLGGLPAVTGKVNHKGQPIKGALVTLHPKASLNDVKVHRPTGMTDEQGNFTVTTGNDAGAAPGEYIVTVVWMKQPDGAGC